MIRDRIARAVIEVNPTRPGSAASRPRRTSGSRPAAEPSGSPAAGRATLLVVVLAANSGKLIALGAEPRVVALGGMGMRGWRADWQSPRRPGRDGVTGDYRGGVLSPGDGPGSVRQRRVERRGWRARPGRILAARLALSGGPGQTGWVRGWAEP